MQGLATRKPGLDEIFRDVRRDTVRLGMRAFI